MVKAHFIGLSLFFTSACLSTAAGWEPYLAVERAESSAYEDVPGGPSMSHTEWIFGVSAFNRWEEGQLALDASYSHLNADWSGGVFPGESSFSFYDEVETLSASAMWTGLPGEKWGYSVLMAARSSRASGTPWDTADFADAMSYTAGLGLNYRYSRDLMIGIMTLYSDYPAGIDEDWNVFPYIYWRINANWTLETRRGLLLSWETARESLQHKVIFSGTVADRSWHLGDSGSREMGYEEEGFALGIAYVLELASGFTLEPQLRYVFEREVDIWEGGRRVASSDLEDSWLYALRLGYAF